MCRPLRHTACAYYIQRYPFFCELPKVNISVSIDAGKLKADAEKMREKIAEKVGPRVKQLEDKANAQGAK